MTHPCLRAVGAATALLLVTIVPVAGQQARPTGQEVRPDADRAREMVFKPELSQEQTAQLATLRKSRAACPGAFPNPTIAVSVAGNWLGTGGADTILNYSTVITNVGGTPPPWIANSIFLAPCTGYYFFTVSFVKDSYYSCTGNVGTQDDVAVYLTRNGQTISSWTNGAWSGEGAGRRGTGAFGVAVRLNQNDAVQSWVHSDGGYHRCLAAYNFTGFRIGN